jgi:hypothetical protein
MATTVWAYREGAFQGVSQEWGYSIPFGASSGLDNLLEKLDELGLHGRIDRLAIVAHGQPGAVHINGANEYPVKDPMVFQNLCAYVPRGGMVEFVGCDIGEVESGNAFLAGLSKLLRDRIIVAYDCKGCRQISLHELGI